MIPLWMGPKLWTGLKVSPLLKKDSSLPHPFPWLFESSGSSSWPLQEREKKKITEKWHNMHHLLFEIPYANCCTGLRLRQSYKLIYQTCTKRSDLKTVTSPNLRSASPFWSLPLVRFLLTHRTGPSVDSPIHSNYSWYKRVTWKVIGIRHTYVYSWKKVTCKKIHVRRH